MLFYFVALIFFYIIIVGVLYFVIALTSNKWKPCRSPASVEIRVSNVIERRDEVTSRGRMQWIDTD